MSWWTLSRAGNWCPREQKVISEFVGYDPPLLFSIAQVDRFVDSQKHVACDCVQCDAYNVNEAAYETRHTDACNGHCEWLGSDALHTDRSFSSVRKSYFPEQLQTVPALTYQDGQIKYVNVNLAADLSVSLTEKWHLPKAGFVAISHVWSDGLGERSIPSPWKFLNSCG